MNIYFLIIVSLQLLSVGVSLAKHGEVKEETYNVFVTLFAAMVSTALVYLAIATGF